ncbi:MAG: ABC transporter [Candidatus Marinimicrobia bacterium]|nr:ABC transporter [Candidatus Neomarinimicrobiota bacterium]|tara:strand:- start:24393 stop:26177 length:1785 start_codon:yes stop_codon:yes gene_type:complete
MQNNNSITSFKRLMQYAKPWRWQVIRASIYSIVNKLFDIAPEILLGVAVDLVVRRENSIIASLGFESIQSQVAILAIATFFIWVFESLFQYLYGITWRNLAQSIEHNLRLDAYNHVQTLDVSWFENKKVGDITAKLNDDVNQLERFLDNGFNSLIQLVVSTVAIGAWFFYISPLVASITILPVPIILLIAFFFQKNLSPRYLAVRNSVGTLNNTIFNNLLGIATIKSFVTETLESDRINQLSNQYRLKNRHAIQLSSAFVPVVRMGVLSGFLGTMVIGSYLALNGTIEVGSYSILIFLTQRFLWPFTTLSETIDLFERSMASTKRVLDLLETEHTITNNKNSVNLDDFNQDIIFNNIEFNYQIDKPLFNELNFTIKKHTLVGIVGQTGAGKTTIIKLLLRFYDPKSGSIIIGDHKINNINIENLRENIGYVSQEIFMFDGSIKDNIAYPPDSFNNDRLILAAQQSQSEEFINKLPNGYDTLVGDRGQKLSVGQKQRLAIARALYKNPPILIFDEATSAIDNETELLIQKALNVISKNRTTIVIAHRLSTVRNADNIIVVGENNIIEQGNHDLLISNNSVYKKLWDIQTGKYENK